MYETLLIYNSILIFSTFFIWLSEKSKKRFFYLSLAFFITFIPAAIRYYIAQDYASYVLIFESISNGFDTRVELGVELLIKAISIFSSNFQWFFIVTSFLIYLYLFKAFNKIKNAWIVNLAFIMLFYLETFSLVRTSICLAMIMYSNELVLNSKKTIKAIIIILLAAFFHKTALLALPFIFIHNRNILHYFEKLNLNYFIIVLILLLFLYKHEAVELINNSYLIKALGYDTYLNSALYMQEVAYNTGYGFALKFIFLIAPLLFYKSINIDNSKKYFYSLYIYMCAISLILSSVITIYNRVNYIFYAGYFYSFYLLWHVRSIYISRVLFFIVLLFYFYLFQEFILKNKSDLCGGTRVSPYVSIFNKESDNSVKVRYEECIQSN